MFWPQIAAFYSLLALSGTTIYIIEAAVSYMESAFVMLNDFDISDAQKRLCFESDNY